MPRVVLLGASALNLGLIAPAFGQRGYSIVVANRISGSPNVERLERLARSGHVRLNRSGYAEDVALELVDSAAPAGGQRLIELLADGDTALVIAATRTSLDHFETVVREAHTHRSELLPIVSADNDPDAWFLERRHKGDLPRYTWLDSIADRLCVRFPPDESVDVVHETYGLWIIEADPANVLTAAIATPRVEGAVDIQLVPSHDFQSYRRRKLWGVNGLHLAIAIMAYERHQILLDSHLSAEGSMESAKAIAGALAAAISVAEPSLPIEDLLHFEESVLFRFAHEHDYTMRVLGGSVMSLPDDDLLQRKIEARLAAPARLLDREGHEEDAALIRNVASRCPRFRR